MERGFTESVSMVMRSKFLLMESGKMSSNLVSVKPKGLVPIKRGTCKVCMLPNHKEYFDKVYDGSCSNSRAAKELGVTTQSWYNHLKYCVRTHVEAAIAPEIEGIAKKVVDHVDELIGQIDRVKGVVDKVYKVVEAEQDIDSKKMQTYVMLERQLGTTIEMLAKMTGELNNSAIINTTNIKIEFEDFKGKIMEILCPICLDKLARIDDESVSEIRNENIITVEK